MPEVHDGVLIGARPRGSIELLDALYTILGTTKSTFWPFVENVGSQIVAYRATDKDLDSRDESAARTLESEFIPYRHPSGVFSYYFDQDDNQHLRAADHGDFSFGNGTTTDAAFSVGLWILPLDITSTVLISKYDAVGTDREWRVYLDFQSKLTMELYDDNANATEIGTGDTAIKLGLWAFVCVTYDGAQADPGVNFYLNGAADGSGTTETGSYVAMQAAASDVIIGANGATTAPANEFNGRIALPFITGKELTADEVHRLYQLGRELLGT